MWMRKAARHRRATKKPAETHPSAELCGVVMLALCVLAAALGTSAANVALPELTAWSGGSYGHAQWVVTAYVLAMTAASLLVGRVGDIFGRERVLRMALALFVVAALVAAMAPTLGVLAAARAVQGIGAAAMITLPLAIAKDAVEPERTGSVMGLLGTVTAAGTAAGPAIGGVLLGIGGWPTVFLAMIPLPVAALLVGLIVGGSRQRRRPSESGDEQATEPRGLLATGAGLNLIVGMVMMSTLVIGPYFLTGALGLGPGRVGLVMAVAPVTSIFAGVLAGSLVDRGDAARLVPLGLGIMVIGAIALALLPSILGVFGYLVGTVTLAPGYQLFMAANNTQIMSGVSAAFRGTASGVLGLSRNLGLLAGTLVLGSLFAAIATNGDVGLSAPEQLEMGMRVTFGGAAAILAVAALSAGWVATNRRTFSRAR